MSEQEHQPHLVLTVPLEVWTCTLSVREFNEHAPFEAFVAHTALLMSDLQRLKQAVGGRLPAATLAELSRRNVLNIQPDGTILKGDVIEGVGVEFHALESFLERAHSSEENITVARNLLTGTFHPMRECSSTYEMKPGDTRLVGGWEHVDHDPGVGEILRPVQGRLQAQFDMRLRDLHSATELVSVDVEPSEIDIAFTWGQRSDGTQMARAHRASEALGVSILDAGIVEELRPKRLTTDVQREWEMAPELVALEAIDTASKYLRACERGLGEATWETAQSLLQDAATCSTKALESILEETSDPRLDAVESIVGTEWEQWEAVHDVLRSATSRAVVLSAFTHEGFADAVAERMNEAVPEGASVLLLSGEPNRINEPEFGTKLGRYVRALNHHGCEVPLLSHTTSKATHAKFVISDTGEVWLGSCNLLSAAPESWVIETAIRAKSANLAASLLDWAKENELVEDGARSFVDEMCTSLHLVATTETHECTSEKNILRQCRNIVELKHLDRKSSRKARGHLLILTKVFRAISERPRWALVSTAEHRPLLLHLVRTSRKSMSIGSDGVSKQGLDRSLIHELGQRPMAISQRASKYSVNVFWGRHDKNHIPQRDRESNVNAGVQIHALREAMREANASGGDFRCLFQPHSSSKPMMTHAKFASMDGLRILVTSDNLLSFGDDEELSTDASELGILIDHPRSAREVVADMQFYIPETQDRDNRDRWYARVAAIAKQHRGQKIPVCDVIEGLIQIAQSSEQATSDFFNLVDNYRPGGKPLPTDCVPYQLIHEAENDGYVSIKYSTGSGKKKQKSGLSKESRNVPMDDERLRHVVVSMPNGSNVWRKKHAKEKQKNDATVA